MNPSIDEQGINVGIQGVEKVVAETWRLALVETVLSRRSSLALARISILMRAAADISLRLFPVYELGFASCNLLVPLSQNILMPCWGLERVRIAAQIVPESLHGLELLFAGHLA